MVYDGITQFNWYSKEWADYNLVPTCILPLMDEILAFNVVSRSLPASLAGTYMTTTCMTA
jgi:hypothetical protein